MTSRVTVTEFEYFGTPRESMASYLFVGEITSLRFTFGSEVVEKRVSWMHQFVGNSPKFKAVMWSIGSHGFGFSCGSRVVKSPNGFSINGIGETIFFSILIMTKFRDHRRILKSHWMKK